MRGSLKKPNMEQTCQRSDALQFGIHLKSYSAVPGEHRWPKREGGRQWHPAVLWPADWFFGRNKKLGWNGPRIHRFLQRRPGAASGICLCGALHPAASVQVGFLTNAVLKGTVHIPECADSTIIAGQIPRRANWSSATAWFSTGCSAFTALVTGSTPSWISPKAYTGWI